MDRPKDLPNRLECAYCKRNHRHGGECHGKDINRNETGCLFFSMDSRGCIRTQDLILPFNLYMDIPPLNMWEDSWTVCENDTEVRINKIYALSWDNQKGLLKVKANVDYYINEFSEEYINNKNKPILKVIK
ncbi:hypothetical protein BCD91_005128 [Clostridium beijerinckii]|uniref:hypothetical protein n=1 Tax=Clostridium beijerinckii TaxID=1520 RepID=UPI001494FA04|nr:hypothetical protein [Clostridium beijerinckii]NOW93105.1 hypothetical protein [Clostridium beijerinckii]